MQTTVLLVFGVVYLGMILGGLLSCRSIAPASRCSARSH